MSYYYRKIYTLNEPKHEKGLCDAISYSKFFSIINFQCKSEGVM